MLNSIHLHKLNKDEHRELWVWETVPKEVEHLVREGYLEDVEELRGHAPKHEIDWDGIRGTLSKTTDGEQSLSDCQRECTRQVARCQEQTQP